MDAFLDDQQKQSQDVQQVEWKQKITSVGEFKGNIESAELLLKGLESGLNYSWQLKHPKNDIPIEIISDETKSSSFISYNISPYGVSIFVKRSFLETASSHTLDTRFTFTTNRDEVAFRGSFKEFFELAGVEEGDHSVYEDFSEGVLKNNQVNSVSEYDAQNHEFHALELQLQYAKENGFSNETIEVLQGRINAAMNIRDSKTK